MIGLEQVLYRPEAANLVVLNHVPDEAVMKKIAACADGVEYRADLALVPESDYIKTQLEKLADLPLLLTIRSAQEGGKWRKSEAKRLELYADLSDSVDGLDVELASPIAPFVIDITREASIEAIISAHNFKETPSDQEIEDMFGQSMEMGADFFKIATKLRTLEDYNRLAKFTIRHGSEGIIVVGMGDGVMVENDNGDYISPRVSLLAIGSAAGYSYAGDGAVAPGQLSCVEMYDAMVQEVTGHADLLLAA